MLSGEIVELAGERCIVIDPEGGPIGGASDARDLIEAALNERATMIAIQVGRLGDEFFQLRSGVAGEILQKAVNYRLKIAVVGDISEQIAASDALRDFVVESNRGRSIFFVSDLVELEQRLAAP